MQKAVPLATRVHKFHFALLSRFAASARTTARRIETMSLSRNVPYHLPKPRGEYIPGVKDVMLDYDEGGLLMRFYYPTNNRISIESKHEKWPFVIPEFDYLEGIANFTRIPSAIMSMVWLYSGKIRIPAMYGEKIRTENKLKCLVFSHGLGSLRSFNSAIFIELASRGYLVAVLEHRDQSACHTYYYKSQQDAKEGKKTTIPFKVIKIGKGHHEARVEQVKQRSNEVCKALDFIVQLNNGKVPVNIIDDVPSEPQSTFNLQDLVGNIDLENLMVGGHSFGAATALRVLANRSDVKLGIILDPWMFSVKDEELQDKIRQPLLFINTETFHIETNIKSLAKFMDDNDKREMYTLLRTTHEIQTDSVFIAGYWLNWFMKKIEPRKGVAINNALMLDFMKRCTGHSESIKDCESLLESNKQHYSSGLTKAWC